MNDDPDVEDKALKQMHKNEIHKKTQSFMTHGRTLFRTGDLMKTIAVWCSYSFDHQTLTGHLAVYKRCLHTLSL